GPSLYRSDRRSGACFLSSCCVLTCLRPVKCDSRHFPVPDSSRHKLALSAVQSECLVTNLSSAQSFGANPSQLDSPTHRWLARVPYLFAAIAVEMPPSGRGNVRIVTNGTHSRRQS